MAHRWLQSVNRRYRRRVGHAPEMRLAKSGFRACAVSRNTGTCIEHTDHAERMKLSSDGDRCADAETVTQSDRTEFQGATKTKQLFGLRNAIERFQKGL